MDPQFFRRGELGRGTSYQEDALGMVGSSIILCS
jgi:hypothetical protein